MTRSPIRPSQTRSSIASYTTRTASPSRAEACAKPPPSAPDLTPKPLREPIKPPTGTDCPPSLGMVPAIVRNAARDQSESVPAIVGIRNLSKLDLAYGTKDLGDLTPRMLAEVIKSSQRHLALSAFFKWCKREEHLTESPMENLRPPVKNPTRARVLSYD